MIRLESGPVIISGDCAKSKVGQFCRRLRGVNASFHLDALRRLII